jgi:glycerate dehydrogenase
MKKIVVLDGYTLNPGDLSWDGFQKIAPIEVYDRTEPASWSGPAAPIFC